MKNCIRSAFFSNHKIFKTTRPTEQREARDAKASVRLKFQLLNRISPQAACVESRLRACWPTGSTGLPQEGSM